ncbi:MAG: hypothetical protein VYA66_04210, partial [SAR324 cluster bacterium]|nr:hypothetical protein [SAR324 cluster bacterium]
MILNDWINKIFPLPKNIGWEEILRDTAFPFPHASKERLANLLDQLVAVKGIPEHLAKFLPVLLSCGAPETALKQLLDFTEAFQKASGSYFSWDRPNTTAFLYIFGRSNFLAIRLKRNPDLADKLLNSPFLLQKKSLEVMESEILKRIEAKPGLSLMEFKNILRRYKYQEYLRITVRDLAELCTFKETLEELSSIAICTLRAALSRITKYELGINNILPNHINPDENGSFVVDSKQIQDSESAEVFPFMILGMGKLGGNELNYSSDVDLIFIHDNEALTGDPQEDYKLRIKSAKMLIDVMADFTEDGFLARMDMRLRPGGDRAQLVQSLDEMELYYSASGQLWERQALIKAVPVAGAFQSGKDFMSMITPFVFRSLLDEVVLHDVEKVKKRIEEEHLRESFLNVKLGVGGIREIEFFVQTFQL